jgi:hypothetical protein
MQFFSFYLLLLLPLQVLAGKEGHENHGGENAPWLSGTNDDEHDHAPKGSPWLSGANEDEHDHGGHGDNHSEYEEPGANLPLLGTFAAINAGFILFGAIRKYRKKKPSTL